MAAWSGSPASIGGCTSSKRKATSREACHCWQIPSQVVLQSLPLDLLPQDHWMPFRVRFSLQTIQWRMWSGLPVSSRIIAWYCLDKYPQDKPSYPHLRLRVLACACMFQLYGSLWPISTLRTVNSTCMTHDSSKELVRKSKNQPTQKNKWATRTSTLVFIPWTPGCLASGYNSPI